MIGKQPPQFILPHTFRPSTPPAIIHCAPIESNTRPFRVDMLWTFPATATSDSDAPYMPFELLRRSLSCVLSDYPVLCASVHEDEQGAVSVHLDNTNPVALILAR